MLQTSVIAFVLMILTSALPAWRRAPPAPRRGQPQPPQPPRPQLAPELATIERIEEVTESFAIALRELALRLEAGQRPAALAHFEPRVEFRPFPSRPGPLQPELKWFKRRSWSPGSPRQGSREELFTSLDAFLAHLPGWSASRSTSQARRCANSKSPWTWRPRSRFRSAAATARASGSG